MHLTDLCIRNVGPLESCDIEPPMNDNGTPKIVTLVGFNGAGKTLLLSSIADAFLLMASTTFTDIVETQGNQRPYFRICGGTNQRTGTPFGLTLLKFEDSGKTSQYIERTGHVSQESEDALKVRFPCLVGQANAGQGNHKNTTGFSNEDVEHAFLKNAYCFFPASRFEPAHWQNLEAFPDVDAFDLSPRFSGRLGKDIIASKSGTENRRWILDVVLDSRIDVQVHNNYLKVTQDRRIIQDHLLFGQACQNIETVLQKVLQDPDARFSIAYRGQGPRIQITTGNGVLIPSLSHLSLGQSILFNLFCTIVRHADKGDLNKGHRLAEIEGIVVIDEAEAHFHEVLRYEILPELISLFPKIQFFIGTHSPSLLLGLRNRFGENGFATYELPTGLQISIERFTEFEHSIRHLQQTSAFETQLLERLSGTEQKPIVLTEGDTDPDYIRVALEILDRNDLLNSVVVEWVGATDAGGNAFNTGDSALDATTKLFQANPYLLNRGMLLLYDCDTKKPDENVLNNLWKRTIPTNNENDILNKGIENLLPASAVTDEDYDTRERAKDYGGSVTTRELNKRRFCDRICSLQDATHFAGFDVIVRILDNFVTEMTAETESAE